MTAHLLDAMPRLELSGGADRAHSGARYTSEVDARAAEQRLRQEGFRHVFAWRDAPDAYYPDHTHGVDTAHVILDGEMTLTCGGVTRTYTTGERPPDVPAGAVHSARIGPLGCHYLVGEK